MRRCWGLGIWLPVAFATAAPQTDLAPETLLLARIKVHMEENLRRLPNYTCLQTVERSRRLAPSRRFELLDTLRLEVAMVDRKEMFSWPGAGKFEDKEISELVQGGTIGNGNFALHAYSVFLSQGPVFQSIGERILDGRRTIRYDYRVPYLNSGFRIRVPPNEAKVAYRGSLWVEAETLDLIRLEVIAEDIPPDLAVSEARDTIGYSRVRIGERDFLLPRSSELLMIDRAGNENRNRTEFSGCRQFAGESFLSFGEPPPPPDAPPAAENAAGIDLPAGLSVDLRLQTPIDSEKSFVGDPVTARVAGNVKKNGAVLIPKGALVYGRIVRLMKQSKPHPHFLVGLQFFTLEFPQRRATFTAQLDQVGFPVAPGGQMVRGGFVPSGLGKFVVESAVAGDVRGLGIFRVMAHRLQLQRGFRMVWKTEGSQVQEKP